MEDLEGKKLDPEKAKMFVAFLEDVVRHFEKAKADYERFLAENPKYTEIEFWEGLVGRIGEEKKVYEEMCTRCANTFWNFRTGELELYAFMNVTGDVLREMNSCKDRESLFDDVLAFTPWADNAHFVHNLGFTQLGAFLNEQSTLGKGAGGGFGGLNYFVERVRFLPDLIEQTICHLKSVINCVNELVRKEEGGVAGGEGADDGKVVGGKVSGGEVSGGEVSGGKVSGVDGVEKESVGKEHVEAASVVDALRCVFRSRIFFDLLNMPGVCDVEEPAPTFSYFVDSGISVRISYEELVEMCYVLVSNAHRVMTKEIREGKNSDKVSLKVFAREVKFEGEDFTVMEFYNTGSQVDLNALQAKLLEMNESVLEGASPEIFKVVRAIKKGSRQAVLHASPEVLVLDGLTMGTGGTGVGLSDMRRHVDGKNGVLMLNNVYDVDVPDNNGFCVTLILPKGKVINPEGLKRSLRTLKELMQSGEYVLSEHVSEVSAVEAEG